ncbi:hypothetical protein ANN_04945 [Periplaneta americana]|uniref:Uncharacterized protein n=1 Tax=Periplaneta americana TaxID=6978 RepID=A0ABQ8T9Q0_PERAM|nr:hypothetical protein ANN_04945 [Periplaneta americana]
MSPRSSTECYPAFTHTGMRQNPGKNFNQLWGIHRAKGCNRGSGSGSGEDIWLDNTTTDGHNQPPCEIPTRARESWASLEEYEYSSTN